MVTLKAAPNTLDRVIHCKKSHALKVLRNASGGYDVTCMKCDFWTTIPAGECLKGWDGREYD